MRSVLLNSSLKMVLMGSAVVLGLTGLAASAYAQDAVATESASVSMIDLGLYPVGGATLEQAVYDLLVANPSLAGELESLLATASAEQKMAIGSAFGRAVTDLSIADADAAEPILLVVSEVTDIDFLTSFAAGSGDAATAAIGEGGGTRGFGINSTAQRTPFAVGGSSGVPNAGAGESTSDANPNGLQDYSFGTIASADFTTSDASISPTTP